MDYSNYLTTMGEYGVVTEIRYPLCVVTGLPKVKPHEVVLFETGQTGEVFSIERERIEIVLFSTEPVMVGTQVVRTNRFLSLPVGEELLGCAIDPLGNPLSHLRSFKKPKEEKEIDIPPRGIYERSRITHQLNTGVSIVDLLITIGKGQRQLIIGDRKTGKTSFLLTTMKKQVQEGSIGIYAAIGTKKTQIKRIQEFFQKEGVMENIVIIASSSYDSPSLIYTAPFSAMTIAEYFCEKGKDVLLILDDMSTHAKFYREIALLARRFPGRDSYPGDIFYTHARLLERAGNFRHVDKGEVSITCFPVVEITEGDLTGYIATNLMGMTDGHIFFDSNTYYKGRRPAINLPLSVTRVGRQTQSKLKREINQELSAFLASYEQIQDVAHFGAELSAKVKTVLTVGEKIYTFFDQHYTEIVPEEIQIILFSLIWLHEFDDKSSVEITNMRKRMIKNYQNKNCCALLKELVAIDSFHTLLLNVSKKKEELLHLCLSNGI